MLKLWWGAPTGYVLILSWQVRPPPLFLTAHSTGVDCMVTLVMSCETFAESSDQLHSAWGITEPFVLGEEMTKSGELVKLLTWRSQHVSWSRLESLEVTKGTILPLDPSSFSAIERIPLPLSARMKKKKHLIICQNRVLQHFLNDKTIFWLFG